MRRSSTRVTNSGPAIAIGPDALANAGSIVNKIRIYLTAPPPVTWDAQVAQEAEVLARKTGVQGEKQRDWSHLSNSPALRPRWHAAPPDLVDHTANIHRGDPRTETMPDVSDPAIRTEPIIDIYQQTVTKRLVVLGRPGSGKSVVARQLALDLLASRTAGIDPVPVVFGVHSWDPATDLKEWLAEQLLRDNYGLEVVGKDGTTLATALIDARRVFPILDGFDEIAGELQRKALSTLGDTSMPLVLTSRLDQYRAAVHAGRALKGAAVIVLDDLTLGDLAAYLPDTTRSAANTAWRPFLDRLRESADGLTGTAAGTALSTPLMAGLARAVYGDGPASDPVELLDVTRFPTRESVETYLLNQFIPAVYDRPRERGHRTWEAEQASRWLAYLARSWAGEGIDLEWWELVNCISPRLRACAFALPGALLGAAAGYLTVGPTGGIIGGLLVAFTGALLGLTRGPVAARMRLRLGGRGKHAFVQLLCGLFGGLLVGLIGWPAVKQWGWLALAPAGALGSAVGSGLSGWARHHDPEAEAKPVRAETMFGAAGGLLGGSAIGLYGLLARVPIGVYAGWLALGLMIGLAFAIGASLLAPTRTKTVVTPQELLAADRRYTVLQSISVGTAYGLVVGALTGPRNAIVMGTAIGLAFGFTTTAWGRWLLLARFWLPASGRLPWRVLHFLDDAHDREVLRQAGAVYQFRHVLLQESVAHSFSPAAIGYEKASPSADFDGSGQ